MNHGTKDIKDRKNAMNKVLISAQNMSSAKKNEGLKTLKDEQTTPLKEMRVRT